MKEHSSLIESEEQQGERAPAPKHRRIERVEQRRVRETTTRAQYDFSHIDFSAPEIQASLARAIEILLREPQRRVCEINEESEQPRTDEETILGGGD